MKFVCGQCHTKYTISDDKVRGKTLKIKCRKCGNIIKVKEPSRGRKTASAPPPSPGSSKGLSALDGLSGKLESSFVEKPVSGPSAVKWVVQRTGNEEGSSQKTIEWFVGIQDQSYGPISAEEFVTLESEGKVGPLSLVWKEGMNDWVEMVSVKPLMAMIEQIKKESDRKPAVPAESGAASDESMLMGAHLGRIGARLDSARVEDQKRVGHISLGPAGQAYSPSLLPPRPRAKGLTYVIIIGFFLAMAACGVTIGWLIVKSTQDRTRQVVAQANKEESGLQETVETKALVNPATQKASMGEVRTDEEKEAKSVRKVANTLEKPEHRKEYDKEQKELFKKMSGLDGEESRTLRKRPDKQVDTEVGESGKGLSELQLRKVVSTNKSSMQRCYQKALRKTLDNSIEVRLKVRINVGPSGVVTDTSILSSNVTDTYLGNCINKTVKRWRFPPASKKSTFDIPFMFTPGG